MRVPYLLLTSCALLFVCATRIPNPVAPSTVIKLNNPIAKLPLSRIPYLQRDFSVLDDRHLLVRSISYQERTLSLMDIRTGAFKQVMTSANRGANLGQSGMGLSPDRQKFFVYAGDRSFQDYVDVVDMSGKRLQSVNTSLISSRKIRASNAIWLRDSKEWVILALERDGFVAYLYELGKTALLRRIPLGRLPGAILFPDGVGATLIGTIEDGWVTGVGNFAYLFKQGGELFEFSINPPYQKRACPFRIPKDGEFHAIALSPDRKRIAWLVTAPNPLWRKDTDVSTYYELWLSDSRAQKFTFAGRFPHGSVLSNTLLWGRGGDTLLVVANGALYEIPAGIGK
ncbi:MAG: hypothetical protein NT023_14905 [Armatimonadetes bacterium]|nr:hypothetical protein [Armatimonadota bacterium]